MASPLTSGDAVIVVGTSHRVSIVEARRSARRLLTGTFRACAAALMARPASIAVIDSMPGTGPPAGRIRCRANQIRVAPMGGPPLTSADTSHR